MSKEELIKQIEGLFPLMNRMSYYDRVFCDLKDQMTQIEEDADSTFGFNFLTDVALGIIFGAFAVQALCGGSVSGDQMIFLLIGVVVGAIVNYKIASKLKDMAKNPSRKKIAKLQEEYDKHKNNMISEISEEYKRAIKIIPDKYAYPECVRTLYDYLITGRADSLKEALNLFEEEQHRLRVENNQSDMESEIQRLHEENQSLAARVAMAEMDAHSAYVQSQYKHD